METEINIVEILKDKPANTKLYSPLFSEAKELKENLRIKLKRVLLNV